MIRVFGWNDFLILLAGLEWTVLLSIIAFVGGSVGGLVVALVRTAPARVLRIVAAGYIDVFQGTPLLMQLFVIYFALPLLGVSVPAWVAVAIGLTLNASAFLGEIWRGAIQAVPSGQAEAATALGLHAVTRLRLVVLPQAFRIAQPATVGYAVQLIKGTSLSAIIGFTELARAGQIIANATYQPLLVFGVVGAMYFVLCWPLSLWSGHVERRLAIGQ